MSTLTAEIRARLPQSDVTLADWSAHDRTAGGLLRAALDRLSEHETASGQWSSCDDGMVGGWRCWQRTRCCSPPPKLRGSGPTSWSPPMSPPWCPRRRRPGN
ncbi:hypothetical protein I552_6006 [Mycobacterium xenopi 3993]|nr:hypothetical protein I552_6006 [Mycobacterium xenopi 3993]